MKSEAFVVLRYARRESIFWILVATAVAALSCGLVIFFSALDDPVTGQGLDVRPLLVSTGLVMIAAVTYIAWPSRWNIIAHGQFVFAMIAYVVPVLGLEVQSAFSQDAVTLYYKVVLAGALATFVGALAGLPLGRKSFQTRLLRIERVADAEGIKTVRRKRVAVAALVALLGMALCFAILGFIPALAADPFSAKFFKGEYANAYGAVAPLYRATTTVITLVIPLVAAYCWDRRDVGWGILLALCLLVMLLTLQRGPAVTGILIFFGVLAAAKRHRMAPYFVALVAVYVTGSALYYALGALGVTAYMGSTASTLSFWENVAAGAPDVKDQLSFIEAWLARPEYTNGLTFIGGLVPGNFHWNPAVWGLSITNPGSDISEIASGGYRLPPPLWGYVSFGAAGVLGVGFLYGLLSSWIAGCGRRMVTKSDLQSSVSDYVVYGAVLTLVTSFYALSYLHLLNIMLVALLLLRRAKHAPAPSGLTPSSLERGS